MDKYFVYDQTEFKIFPTEQKQLSYAKRLAAEGKPVYCGFITHVYFSNITVNKEVMR